MKKETDIAKRQYQGLDKVYEFDEKKGDETIDKDDKKYNKSDLIYDANHSTKKSGSLALKSKSLFLANFCDDLDKFSRLKPQKEKHTQKKQQMCMIQLRHYIICC